MLWSNLTFNILWHTVTNDNYWQDTAIIRFSYHQVELEAQLCINSNSMELAECETEDILSDMHFPQTCEGLTVKVAALINNAEHWLPCK